MHQDVVCTPFAEHLVRAVSGDHLCTTIPVRNPSVCVKAVDALREVVEYAFEEVFVPAHQYMPTAEDELSFVFQNSIVAAAPPCNLVSFDRKAGRREEKRNLNTGISWKEVLY
jgi:poly-beta-hydroxyalkanoate depolymerase